MSWNQIVQRSKSRYLFIALVVIMIYIPVSEYGGNLAYISALFAEHQSKTFYSTDPYMGGYCTFLGIL